MGLAALAFRLLQGQGQRRRAGVEAAARRATRQAQSERSAPPIEDMRACPQCGTYRPATMAKGCGRSDCPDGPAPSS